MLLPLDTVKKYCRCGCGKSWKTLPTSKGEYFSETHDPLFKKKLERIFNESLGRRTKGKNPEYLKTFYDDTDLDGKGIWEKDE